MAPENCASFFDCSDPKKNGLTLEQVMRLMIVPDANGCPQWRGFGSSAGTVTINYPLNSATGDKLIEADTNTLLEAAIAAWRAANPTFKQIGIVNANSVDKQAVIITYTT